MTTLLILSVYKSRRKDEMYLWVYKEVGLKNIPQPLLDLFGPAEHVMDIPILGERKFARVDNDKLQVALKEQGFYLQMPPQKEDYLLDLYNPDDSKYRDLP